MGCNLFNLVQMYLFLNLILLVFSNILENGPWLIHAPCIGISVAVQVHPWCWESAMCNFDLYLTVTCTINCFKSKETVSR